MENKNSFLSRLFKKKPEVKAAAEPEAVEVRKHSPVQHTAEVQPKKPSQHWLELPQEHAIYKLCALYREQTGLTAKPELVLEGPGDPCLSDKSTVKFDITNPQDIIFLYNYWGLGELVSVTLNY